MVKVTLTGHFNSDSLPKNFSNFSPLLLPYLVAPQPQGPACAMFFYSGLCLFWLCVCYASSGSTVIMRNSTENSKVSPIVLLQFHVEPNPHQTYMFVKFLN